MTTPRNLTPYPELVRTLRRRLRRGSAAYHAFVLALFDLPRPAHSHDRDPIALGMRRSLRYSVNIVSLLRTFDASYEVQLEESHDDTSRRVARHVPVPRFLEMLAPLLSAEHILTLWRLDPSLSEAPGVAAELLASVDIAVRELALLMVASPLAPPPRVPASTPNHSDDTPQGPARFTSDASPAHDPAVRDRLPARRSR